MPTPINEFIKRMGLDQGNLNSNTEGLYRDMLERARLIQVVPLPDLSETIKIILMEEHYLELLIKCIDAYKRCEFSLCDIDPLDLRTTRKFARKDKFISVVENHVKPFSKLTTYYGIRKTPPCLIIGKDKFKGQISLAHYLPPIIEKHRNPASGITKFLIADGFYRSLANLKVGVEMQAIIVENPNTCAFSLLCSLSRPLYNVSFDIEKEDEIDRDAMKDLKDLIETRKGIEEIELT